MVENNAQGDADYEVGYKRPPKNRQFKPGDRANPRGRPRGSPNKKTLIVRALQKKIPVRRGDKTTKTAALEAMTETFLLKAVQGDYRAADVVINLASKVGAFDAHNDNAPNSSGDRGVITGSARPSDALVESVDPNLLAEAEQIDLSKLAERIDRGGDILALDADDLLRFRQLVNKGRGATVAPTADDCLDEAA